MNEKDKSDKIKTQTQLESDTNLNVTLCKTNQHADGRIGIMKIFHICICFIVALSAKQAMAVTNPQPIFALSYSTLNIIEPEIGAIMGYEGKEKVIGVATLFGAGFNGAKVMAGIGIGHSGGVSYSGLLGKVKYWDKNEYESIVGLRICGILKVAYYYSFDSKNIFEIGFGI